MRIEISEEVWNEIARNGKFGESEDDVLRRLLNIAAPPSKSSVSSRSPTTPTVAARAGRPLSRERFAKTRMSSYVQNETLVVEFAGGPRSTFALPSRDDKPSVRHKRDEAVEFARQNGASYGQEMAVKKALTEAGYHLVK